MSESGRSRLYRRLLRRLGLVLTIVFGLGSNSTLRGDDISVDVQAIVDSVASRSIKTDKVAGLSVGVAKDDSIICVREFGLANVEHDIAAKGETVFRIGSITKEFTATAILLLVEEGKVELEDPLSKFLPEYPLPAANVTIRQLLQHTSGIKDFTRLPTYRRDRQVDAAVEEVLGRFKELPLEFEPGEKHRYCNSGYFLLGLVVEKASGESYREFVEKRLFKVAGLKHTYCDDLAGIIPNRAAGYSRWDGKLRNATHVSLKQSVGAGNMASTARDLLAWQQALIGHRLLSKESLALMTTKGKLTSGKSFGYGMGVFIRRMGTHEVVRHGGGISGFRSDLAWYPDSGYIIAVLANSDNAKAPQISDRIARRLLPNKTDEKTE